MRDRYCVSCSDAGIDDDVMTAAAQLGKTPEEFVKSFADKYGLISKEDYNPNSVEARSIVNMLTAIRSEIT